MSKTTYTDAEFQKDLAELTNLINNYDSSNDMKKRKTDADEMEGGKRRKSKKRSHKKSKKSSKKRGGDDMEGGKKRRKSAKKSSKKSSKRRHSKKSHRGGKKRVHKVDVDGKLLRSFRVIRINGKDVSKDPHWSQRFYHGKFRKNTALQSARQSYRWMCKHLKEKLASCKVEFLLQETTKGSSSAGKVFGPYKGSATKLAKPKIFKRKDKRTGKMKTIESHYVYSVKLAKSSHK